jgi:hypothetical protein
MVSANLLGWLLLVTFLIRNRSRNRFFSPLLNTLYCLPLSRCLNHSLTLPVCHILGSFLHRLISRIHNRYMPLFTPLLLDYFLRHQLLVFPRDSLTLTRFHPRIVSMLPKSFHIRCHFVQRFHTFQVILLFLLKLKVLNLILM